MKIRFKTISANENGVIQAGQVVDVDNKTAKMLVDGGFAEVVEVPAEPVEEPVAEVKPAPKRGRKKVE